MKKQSFIAAFAALVMMSSMTSCEKQFLADGPGDYAEYDGDRTRVTFAVSGYSQGNTPHPASVPSAPMFSVTRAASLNADGKDMTDIWLLDYQNGQLVQQLHQQAGDPDFGTPSLTMDYGQHTLYFVASRGKQPLLSTADHTISWQTPSDTFYKAITLDVAANTEAAQTVTLQRVSTKLSVTINDALPSDIATISLEPTNWYYAIDYTDGSATGAQQQGYTFNIPSSMSGSSGNTFSFYGMSSTTEWQADITLTARDADDNILGQAVIRNAPFKANRITNYSGNLFTANSGFTLSLASEWSEAYNGQW
jgi:hypothetical protein